MKIHCGLPQDTNMGEMSHCKGNMQARCMRQKKKYAKQLEWYIHSPQKVSLWSISCVRGQFTQLNESQNIQNLCSHLICLHVYLSVCVPTGLVCISVLPPRRGSYYVEHGTGVSVGSMLVFWCKEGYQLVGHEKITCILHAGVPRWSSYLPVCESRAAIQLPFMERNVS